MPETVPPSTALRAFDIAAGALSDDCAERFEAGRSLASTDTDRLWTLAVRIAADLAAWTASHRELDVARGGEFPPTACARRLVEALFDDSLTPCAARVLSAALDVALAVKSRPVHDGKA